MSGSFPTLTLDSVLVEGLDPDKAREVEAEVRLVLGPYEGIDFALKGQLHFSVIITGRMEHHVDQIRRERGFDLPPYQRMRNAVQAAGIVISTPGGPPFQATMVLDNEPWTLSEGHAVATRVYLLGHEFGHLVQKGAGTGTAWEEWRGLQPTHALAVREAAAVLIDEVDADITAYAICQATLRDDTGHPARCSELFGERFLAAAQDLCQQLCEVAVDVQLYRVTNVGLEDLLPRARTLLSELLLVIGHAVPLYAADGNADQLLDRLGAFLGYNAYIRDDFELFSAGLTADIRPVAEQKIVQAILGMFGRLGLRVEDLPDGGYFLHVDEPVFCEECQDQREHTDAA